jgi:hypothetical protein
MILGMVMSPSSVKAEKTEGHLSSQLGEERAVIKSGKSSPFVAFLLIYY